MRLNKALGKYVNKYLSTRLVFLLDLCLSFFASLLALVLVDMFILDVDLIRLKAITIWIGASIVFSFLAIWLLRTYRIIIRHTTLKDLAKFGLVSLLKVLATAALFTLLMREMPMVYLVMLADFFLTFAFFFIMRVAMLMTYDAVKARMDHRKECQNVLVYGVGVKSVSLIARLENSSHYNIVGFLQFGKSSVNHVIAEKKTYYVSTEQEFHDAIAEVEADGKSLTAALVQLSLGHAILALAIQDFHLQAVVQFFLFGLKDIGAFGHLEIRVCHTFPSFP